MSMDKQDTVHRWVVDDIENTRFEDSHIDPYVHLRRISTDPAIREVSFPPNARLGVHSHPCDTLYIIQSGEFIVDGEGTYRPGELRWVRGGATYGPERAGPEGTVLLIVSTNGTFGLEWEDEEG
jgi:quercetin dioxygenase-like cupin family protein